MMIIKSKYENNVRTQINSLSKSIENISNTCNQLNNIGKRLLFFDIDINQCLIILDNMIKTLFFTIFKESESLSRFKYVDVFEMFQIFETFETFKSNDLNNNFQVKCDIFDPTIGQIILALSEQLYIMSTIIQFSSEIVDNSVISILKSLYDIYSDKSNINITPQKYDVNCINALILIFVIRINLNPNDQINDLIISILLKLSDNDEYLKLMMSKNESDEFILIKFINKIHQLSNINEFDNNNKFSELFLYMIVYNGDTIVNILETSN